MARPDMTNHLLKRGSRYYIRRKIPVDLQAHYDGRKEIVRALGTADPARARVRVREESSLLDKEFDALRSRLTQAAPQPGLVYDPLEGKWVTPRQPPTADTMERNERDNEDDLRLSAEPLEVQEANHDAWTAREAKRKAKHERRVTAYEAALRRVMGSLPAVSSDPMADVLTVPERPSRGAGGSASSGHLAALVEQWERERKPEAQTVRIMNKVVQRFYTHVGRIAVRSITKAHVIDFKNKLLESGQTAVNTNKQLTMLSTLLNFAADNLQATSNAAKGVKVGERSNAKAARLPFDVPALQAIFSSPVYTSGFQPERVDWDTAAAYWFPLIALYSGARLEEIAQLSPADVYEETYYADEDDNQHSVWVFRFTNTGEGQGVKTESSVRRIPVHAVLIERGLIDLVRSRKGAARIFAMATDSRGREGANWGKWFGKYLRGSCGVTDRRMSFHSFRHTFKDVCRARGIVEEVHDALTGHASGKVSRKVYGGLTYPLAPLVEAMSRYRVQGLTLPAKPKSSM